MMQNRSTILWFTAASFLVCSIGGGAAALGAPAASPVCKPAPSAGAKGNKVAEWFQQYNEIRHRAQMSPQEKERSGRLLTQGLAASVFKSADSEQDKAAAQALLKRMVDRYNKAQSEIDALQSINETKKLQIGYKQYFHDAGSLFSDYLKINGNLFATDESGNALLPQLQARKTALEQLDVTNKDLDAKLRDKYNIGPYPY